MIDGRPNYNYGPIKFATLISIFWGIAGFTVGLWAALELSFPELNLGLPWTSFGRIRPLHTSAVIFAFGGNVLIATLVLRRPAHRRARPSAISRRGSWCWATTFISSPASAISSASQSKEYAEPEWRADLWLTVVWVVYPLAFGTILRRRSRTSMWRTGSTSPSSRCRRPHLGNNAAIPSRSLSRRSPTSSGRACRTPGAVVVRPQRRLLHRRLPRLRTFIETGRPAGLFYRLSSSISGR
jgi:cytochrome c oxidase cbb3-type subunit 1